LDEKEIRYKSFFFRNNYLTFQESTTKSSYAARIDSAFHFPEALCSGLSSALPFN